MKKLSHEELYVYCDTGSMPFETTADITTDGGTIGQKRAMAAMDFGLGLESRGFNLYVLGEHGTGKMTSIKQRIKTLSAARPTPPDWCYVNNFRDPDAPLAVWLPAGQAAGFGKAMGELVHTLRVEIPRIFESKEYEKSRSQIVEAFQREQKGLVSQLEEEAKSLGFSIRKTVSGLLVVPIKQSGDALTEDEFEALDDEHKARVEQTGKRLQEKLDDVVRVVRAREKEIKASLDDLEREAALSAVGHLIDEVAEAYAGHERIKAWLDDVREDILGHIEDFKIGEDGEQASPLPFIKPQKAEPTFTRYAVNVLVDNSGAEGAPCVFESNPTYYNLFGRIEHKFQYGMAMTDFSMIKSGSLHKANGGYIVIEAMDLLRNLFSYDALKRSIRNRELKIEDIWEQYRLVTSTSLKPEAIALDVKVILIGSTYLYYLLYNLDEEYRELFKVKADFESRMERNDDSMRKYAEFIAAKCMEEKLLPFDRSGVARVIEHGTRLADDQGKLSSRFSDVADLLREAHYWAGQDASGVVGEAHVERAIRERVYRHSRIEDRMREMMEEDTIIVETSGARVGQINGLAVLSMGDYSFGKPSRITARAYAGRAGIVNIERETKMSGRIHDKAIMIISSYLGSTYAARKPLSLTAVITFEQLYEMIEGDSATCAELYALLSSIAGVPLSQEYAVTGSMDQNGDVQPIGGVNEKVEGFFDLCKARGLTGTQGVIIPSRNIRHLMLKREVVEAVKAGQFHMHAIDRMEEGLELLTGMPAGARGEDGTYPEGTLNRLVAARLEELAEAQKPQKDNEEKKVVEEGACDTCGSRDPTPGDPTPPGPPRPTGEPDDASRAR